MTFGWQGSGKRALEFPDGAPVSPFVGLSPVGRGRIRYNKALNRFEKSLSGADWEALVMAGGASPWMEAAGTVSLVTTTNDVVVGPGAIVGSERLRVVGDALIDSNLSVNEVTLPELGADPAAVADNVKVYAKDVAGTSQLFARADDGTVSQLTPAGAGAATGTSNLTFEVNDDAVAGSDEDPCLILAGGDGGAEVVESFLCQDSSADELYLWTALSTVAAGDGDRTTDLTIGPQTAFDAVGNDADALLSWRGHKAAEAVTDFKEIMATLDASADSFEITGNQPPASSPARQGTDIFITSPIGSPPLGAAQGGRSGNIRIFGNFGAPGTATGQGGDGANIEIIGGEGGFDSGAGIGASGTVWVEAGVDGDGFGGTLNLGTGTASLGFTRIVNIGSGIGSALPNNVNVHIADNEADAFTIISGFGGTARNYMIVTSTNGSEAIDLGNPDNDPDISLLGQGAMSIGDAGAAVGFYGTTPAAQQATTGTVAGFTGGAGNNVDDDATFTGGTGAAAYTIGDIILALKNYGLLAA